MTTDLRVCIGPMLAKEPGGSIGDRKSEVEVMLSSMQGETTYRGEQRPRRALLWYAVILTLAGMVLTTILWLLVSAWKGRTNSSLFETSSRKLASFPMQVGPLITGKDKATAAELVYLSRVSLEPGPAPKVFFLTGSQGAQILTVAEGAHVLATPGKTVDVRGTIRSTPSVATLRKQWKLNPAEAKRISSIPIYIESDFIRESVHANVSREEYP
jgi:hypothetical protein